MIRSGRLSFSDFFDRGWVKKAKSNEVTLDFKEKVGGDKSLGVGGKVSEKFGGAHSVDVGGDVIRQSGRKTRLGIRRRLR